MHRDIVYCIRGTDADPAPLCLDIYLPKKQTRKSVIVYMHGGGFKNGDRQGAEAAGLADRFCASGFAFASVSYRLNTQIADFPRRLRQRIRAWQTKTLTSGLTLAPDLCGAAFVAAVEDADRAVAFLRSSAADYGAKCKSVGMVGVSAGAISAVALAYPTKALARRVHPPERVLAICGAVAQPWCLVNDGPPVLMFHGARDRIIPVHNLRIAKRHAAKRGAPLELVLHQSSGHKDQLEHVLSGNDESGSPNFETVTRFFEPLH